MRVQYILGTAGKKKSVVAQRNVRSRTWFIYQKERGDPSIIHSIYDAREAN